MVDVFILVCHPIIFRPDKYRSLWIYLYIDQSLYAIKRNLIVFSDSGVDVKCILHADWAFR